VLAVELRIRQYYAKRSNLAWAASTSGRSIAEPSCRDQSRLVALAPSGDRGVHHNEPLKPPTPEHGLTTALLCAPDVEGADRARCQPGCIHCHDRCRLLLSWWSGFLVLRQALEGLIQSGYQGALVEAPKEALERGMVGRLA
jgi:hypothetical protein